jgi:hypothetical protein
MNAMVDVLNNPQAAAGEVEHAKHVVEAAIKPVVTAFDPVDAANGITAPLYGPLVARSRFNNILDAIYYNVTALTDEEREQLFRAPKPEGTLLLVGPRSAPVCNAVDSAKKFLAELPVGVDTVVVAGVGSSMVGTAALAREVANYLQRPVAGVVSGYGYADAFGEGMGGFLGLEPANSMARLANGILNFIEPLRPLLSGWVKKNEGGTAATALSADQVLNNVAKGAVAGIRDSDVLAQVLDDPRFKVVLGHSKGNFVIANALRLMKRPIEQVQVITLGAPLFIPEEVKHHQILGGFDLFGWMNTRVWPFQYTVQPFAFHRVKEGCPFALHVSWALAQAGVPSA